MLLVKIGKRISSMQTPVKEKKNTMNLTGTYERAKRAKSARMFAGLTMEQMNIQHNIPPSTIQGWENIGGTSLKNRKLTLKGAQRLIAALNREGVACTIEWLMEGEGIGPHFINQKEKSRNTQNSLWGHHLAIQAEIKTFEENNLNSIVVMVADNGLEPFYSKGDFVGAIKQYLKDIDKYLNHLCIIETSNKEVFIRKLISGKKTHTYTLLTLQNNDQQSESSLQDVKVNWVAPIIWHRKPF